MAAGGELMDPVSFAPSRPGTQIRQVGPGGGRRVADEEGGRQPPERIRLRPGGGAGPGRPAVRGPRPAAPPGSDCSPRHDDGGVRQRPGTGWITRLPWSCSTEPPAAEWLPCCRHVLDGAPPRIREWVCFPFLGTGTAVPLDVSCLFGGGLASSELRYRNYFWPLQAQLPRSGDG